MIIDCWINLNRGTRAISSVLRGTDRDTVGSVFDRHTDCLTTGREGETQDKSGDESQKDGTEPYGKRPKVGQELRQKV